MKIVSDHRRLDERSIALHREVAVRFQADPGLVRDVIETLDRWEKTSSGSWLMEWRGLLMGSHDVLLAFLVSSEERAARLRQSSPFTGILTAADRKRIYESFAA